MMHQIHVIGYRLHNVYGAVLPIHDICISVVTSTKNVIELDSNRIIPLYKHKADNGGATIQTSILFVVTVSRLTLSHCKYQITRLLFR